MRKGGRQGTTVQEICVHQGTNTEFEYKAIVSNPTKTGFFNDVIGGVLGGPQKASLLDKVNAHAA